MKLRDKILYMSFGAGLVVLGMVLNSLIIGLTQLNNQEYSEALEDKLQQHVE